MTLPTTTEFSVVVDVSQILAISKRAPLFVRNVLRVVLHVPMVFSVLPAPSTIT